MDEIDKAEQQRRRQKAMELSYLASLPRLQRLRSTSGIATPSSDVLSFGISTTVTDNQAEQNIPAMNDTERAFTVFATQQDTPAPLPYPNGAYSFLSNILNPAPETNTAGDRLANSLRSGRGTEETPPGYPDQYDTYPLQGLPHTGPTLMTGIAGESQPPPRKKARMTYSTDAYAIVTAVSTTEPDFEDIAAMEAAAAVVDREEGPATQSGFRRSGRHLPINYSSLTLPPIVPGSDSAASAPKSKSPMLVRKTAKSKVGARAGSARLSQPQEVQHVQPRIRGVAVKAQARPSEQSLSPLRETQNVQPRTRGLAIKVQKMQARSETLKTPSPSKPLHRVIRHNYTPGLNSRHRDITSDHDDDNDEEEEDMEDNAGDEHNEGDSDAESQSEVSDSPVRLAPPHRGRHSQDPPQRRSSSAHCHGTGYKRLTGHVTDGDALSISYATSLIMRMGDEKMSSLLAIKNQEKRADGSPWPRLVGSEDTATPVVHTPAPVQRLGFDGVPMVPRFENPFRPLVGRRVFGGVVAGASEMEIAALASLEEQVAGRKRKADDFTQL